METIMKIISGKDFNVAAANGAPSRITWAEFKDIMQLRGFIFDESEKVFYLNINGKRDHVDMCNLAAQAYYYGFYDSLDDYVERGNIP